MPSSKKQKPSNAYITDQKAWAKMSKTMKNKVRKVLPDSDKDHVPDGFDCRPTNKRKQESFLPEDAAYIKKTKKIQLDKKFIGRGDNGTIYPIKGNKNLVIKVNYKNDESSSTIEEDSKFFTKNKLSKQPLFCPTKLVKINSKENGLVQPRLTVLVDPDGIKNKEFLTPDKLETIRKQIILLTYKGFRFYDGYQIGMDRTGRLLLFDLGNTHKIDMRDPVQMYNNFHTNDTEWQDLAKRLHKKLGSIARTKELDKKFLPAKFQLLPLKHPKTPEEVFKIIGKPIPKKWKTGM